MPDLIATLTEERAQVADALEQLASADDFNPEAREWGDLKTRGEHLDKRLVALREAQEQRSSANTLRDMLTRAPALHTTMSTDVGDQLVRSESWKTWIRNGAGGRAHLMDIDINRRALITTSFLPSQHEQIVAAPPAVQTPLLNVMSSIQVSSKTIDVIYYAAQAPPASVVAEGALKPESALTPTVTPVTLETLAHWIEATRQAIADNAMVRDLITNGLLRGVNDKAESQAAGVITGGSYATVAGANMLESIRGGVAAVQTAGYRPNAVLINPVDAAGLDGTIWALPGSGGPSISSSVFGMTLVPVGALTAGTAYVGDFQLATKFLYMGTAQLYVTDSDVGPAGESNFKRNIITFLAEQYCKTAVVRPEAIVKCTPTGGLITTAAAPAAQTSGSSGTGSSSSAKK